MARYTLVKSARKNYPDHGIKKGESYYWWKFRFGGKRFSKTPPRRSQLTQSDFYSQLYDMEDEVGDLKPDSYATVEDLQSDLDDLKSRLEDLGGECQEKHDNMPDGLQQGDTGQLLEERVSEVESLVSEFDGIDYEEPDAKGKKLKEAVRKRCEEIIEEVGGFNWSIS